MKAFTRMCAAFVVTGMIALSGCGPDNETEGQNLAKSAGNPGAENPNATKVEAKPVNSQLEHFQQSQNALKAQQGKGGPPAAKK